MKRFASLFSREEGSVFVIVALGIMMLVGAVGTAVDVGRGQIEQTKLQNALDAAGLAAGASGSNDIPTLTAIINKYMNVNFTGGTLGAAITSTTPVLSNSNSVLTIDVYASMPTTLMQVFGRKTMNIHASTQVTRSNTGLELALVLDTTGSMADYIDSTGLNKIQELQADAHLLINTLFGSATTGTNLWIGIVPFSQAVNVGSSRTNWLSINPTTLNWGTGGSWGGCVDARWTGNDVTAAPPFTPTNPASSPPPTPEKFYPYLYPSDNSNNPWGSNETDSSSYTLCSGSGSCVCGTTYVCGTTINGATSISIACSGTKNSNRKCTETYSVTTAYGPNFDCPNPLTPLTNVKQTLSDAIDALYPAGGTHIPEGLAWGWRLLDQDWRGVWGGTMDTNKLPLNYGTPLMNKAVVLMTDGMNTMYYAPPPPRGQASDRTAYGYLTDNRLGTKTDVTVAEASLDTKLTTDCTAMKAKGIIIYTILFNETDANVTTLLQNCASQKDYFFTASDGSSLQSAFQTIGASLANLRISK